VLAQLTQLTYLHMPLPAWLATQLPASLQQLFLINLTPSALQQQQQRWSSDDDAVAAAPAAASAAQPAAALAGNTLDLHHLTAPKDLQLQCYEPRGSRSSSIDGGGSSSNALVLPPQLTGLKFYRCHFEEVSVESNCSRLTSL
jgi:hypothetical protein